MPGHRQRRLFPKGIGPAQTNLLTMEIFTSFIEMAEIRVNERWTRSPKAGRTVFGALGVRRTATLSDVAAHEIVARVAD
jgi:hypothetical protein